ncbi:MAG: ComF family protein [Patulibacter sp.]|nr:ComF family protein [Patulibacter sp.]
MPRLDETIVGALVPARCLHCRGPARGPELLCRRCRGALPWLPVTGCRRCGLPVRCARGRCPAARAAFAAAWAPLGYEGPARTLAWAQKERATARVARWLAAAMVVRGPDGWLADVDVVVPVPADPLRRRRRGTDHAARLASAVGGRLDRPVVSALARVGGRGSGGRGPGGGPRAPQHRLGRGERGRIAMPELIAPVHGTVLLIDDVHTTGATLHAAARSLRGGGAVRVLALTAFRAE